jgi:two-component sensor histidine kinase
MTRPSALADLLVVDAPMGRRADYERSLTDLVRTVVFATSSDDIERVASGYSFAAVLVHLDTPGGAYLDPEPIARLLLGRSGVPVIFISAEVSRILPIASRLSGPFDYLPWPIVPELLRAKVRVFLDLARALDAATELARERDLLAVAAEGEKRRADALIALAGEHVHRGKNLLAIIQSISLRTISDGRNIADARVALIGRLRAIARAYQMVTASGRSSAELGDIVEAGLGEAAHRVLVSGPPVRLRGSVVQTFLLAVHELVVNSLAYGALSAESGSVIVGWTFFECGEESYLEMDWTERGGPIAVSPQRQGFGLSLLSSLAGPGASLPNVSFEAPGFACRLRLPQDMITAD